MDPAKNARRDGSQDASLRRDARSETGEDVDGGKDDGCDVVKDGWFRQKMGAGRCGGGVPWEG